MDFEFIGAIRDIEPIAFGQGIRDLPRLQKYYAKELGENLKEWLSYA